MQTIWEAKYSATPSPFLWGVKRIVSELNAKAWHNRRGEPLRAPFLIKTLAAFGDELPDTQIRTLSAFGRISAVPITIPKMIFAC